MPTAVAGSKIAKNYFVSAGKFMRLSGSKLVDMLTHPCNIKYTMFYFVLGLFFLLVQVTSTRLYISEYKFNNMEDINLILYVENSTYGITILLVIGQSGQFFKKKLLGF